MAASRLLLICLVAALTAACGDAEMPTASEPGLDLDSPLPGQGGTPLPVVSTPAIPGSGSPAPVASKFETPADAALALYDAWQVGNRTGGLQAATPEAVEQIFAVRATVADFGGCQSESGAYVCVFLYDGGRLDLTVAAEATRGHIVTEAGFKAG